MEKDASLWQGDDLLEVYDENGQRLGLARRGECHGNPALIHRTAHVVVIDGQGRLLLQKRPAHKDTQPGRWDTAVGGHLDPGEDFEEAARREMQEEVGIPADAPLQYLFDRKIRNDRESEDVRVFMTCWTGPFHPSPEEIEELRFWSLAELKQALGTGVLTPSLEEEIRLLEQHCPGIFDAPAAGTGPE